MTTNTGRAAKLNPWLFDGVLTTTLLIAGILSLFLYSPATIDYHDGDALGVVLIAVVTVPVLLRRRWPVGTALGVTVIIACLIPWDYAMPTIAVIILITIYSAANYSTFARSLVVTSCLLATSLVYLVVSAQRHDDADIGGASFVVNIAIFASSWAVGRAVRNRRLYTAELEGRAERLEQTSRAEIRAAIAEERSRIARELHDVVAHHVSVMTVQAAGARRSLDRDPNRSATALQAIELTGRSALSEMRRIVGVLRDSEVDRHDLPAELSPQPGLHELDRLADHLRAAGLPVEIIVEGRPGPVPVGVELTAFRVVQEALTNTVKHAGPSQASVRVRYLPNELRIRVSDNGRGAAAALDGHRPGHGLLGMRERVTLYGGTLAVGPRPGGGFEVRATIPYDNTAV